MSKTETKPKTMKVYPTAAFVIATGQIAKPDLKCEREPVELPTAIAEGVIGRGRAITEEEGKALKAALAKKGGKKDDTGAGTPPAA